MEGLLSTGPTPLVLGCFTIILNFYIFSNHLDRLVLCFSFKPVADIGFRGLCEGDLSGYKKKKHKTQT